MNKKEVPLWAVETRYENITTKASIEEAFLFTKAQPGFVGGNLDYPEGVLWLFDSYKNAEKAMAAMQEAGIRTGSAICKVFVEERYLCQNPN